MADDDDSTDSDGWGAEELVIPPVGTKDNTSNGKSNDDGENDLGDDYWKVETKKTRCAGFHKRTGSRRNQRTSVVVHDHRRPYADGSKHSQQIRSQFRQPTRTSIRPSKKNRAELQGIRLFKHSLVRRNGDTLWIIGVEGRTRETS